MTHMTGPLCLAPDCTARARAIRPASKNGRYCEKHRQVLRRQGDPRQCPILVRDLKPHLKAVRRIVAKDSSAKIETVLTALHQTMLDYVGEIVSDAESGQWVFRWTARSAREMRRVLLSVKPVDVGVRMASMFLLREYQPYLFVSQAGFLHQLAKTFLRLVDSSWGSYWHVKAGRVKKVYKLLPTRCMAEIGATLNEAFAPFASRVCDLDQRKRKQGQAIRKALDEAFASIDKESTSR